MTEREGRSSRLPDDFNPRVQRCLNITVLIGLVAIGAILWAWFQQWPKTGRTETFPELVTQLELWDGLNSFPAKNGLQWIQRDPTTRVIVISGECDFVDFLEWVGYTPELARQTSEDFGYDEETTTEETTAESSVERWEWNEEFFRGDRGYKFLLRKMNAPNSCSFEITVFRER